MSREIPAKITFRVTVTRLTLSSRLPQQDIRVTVCVDDVSKITCSGEQSRDGLMVTWNHPFLFTAPPSMDVKVTVTVYALPKLAPGWNKQQLGNPLVTNVASLICSSNRWQCNILGLSAGPAALSMTCSAYKVLVAPDGHYCVSALRKYDKRLYKFSAQFKNLPCLSTKIELGLARLDLCPLGHADHTDALRNLAHSYEFQYDQGGGISGLNRAIEIKQTRLDLCPLGHPDHADALAELAVSLQKHYHIQKNKVDLNRIIEMQQQCLDLCPPGHPDHAEALGGLATSLWERYCTGMQRDMADLNRSIQMDEERLGLCPKDHPQYGEALGNLASSIKARYHKQKDLLDLNKAIGLQEEKLHLRPPDHRSHGIAAQNLALSLKDRYNKMKDHSDLTKAIDLFKQALATYPSQHHDFAFIAGQLAASILLSPNLLQRCYPPDQSLSLPDQAFETYRLLKKCAPAVSLDLWRATLAWVKDAEQHNHPSVLEAYQTALNTLDHFIFFNSSLDSRHQTMQGRVADLANNAFSRAIRDGKFQSAVELLEQGRGMLWAQLSRSDTSITALEDRGNVGRELRHQLIQFGRWSMDLRRYAEGKAGKGKVPYWKALEKWQSVVDKIRNLGFPRFLLPPHFEDLQEAAKRGPVIILNARKHKCDALIVHQTGRPVHISLHESLDDVIQLCSELTRDPYAYENNRELYVKRMLRDLWSVAVKRIVSALQNDIQHPPGSRIWWCPTSKFTLLPFHAAGPYQKGEKNLMDLYISSYAPSLSALIRTRDRIRSQKEARDASRTTNVVSFAAVGQSRPSADTKQKELPEVEREIDKIRDEAGMHPEVKFETVTGPAATVEGAVRAFRDHRWVHLACHGAQHARKPFESWFAMGDGKLTLLRIIQERYMNSEFAFLSACRTAVGDESMPDEVLHLAAGMQFAGFNGVIGTLWKVDDAVVHQVVTRFYKEMFKRPVLDFENAAEALNVAVVESASEVSLEKRIVFVHIGI